MPTRTLLPASSAHASNVPLLWTSPGPIRRIGHEASWLALGGVCHMQKPKPQKTPSGSELGGRVISCHKFGLISFLLKILGPDFKYDNKFNCKSCATCSEVTPFLSLSLMFYLLFERLIGSLSWWWISILLYVKVSKNLYRRTNSLQ